MQVSMAACRKRLTILWFTWAAIVFFVLLFQSFFGRYGERVSEAWEWLLPTILPTLSLIVGVMIAGAVEKAPGNRLADRFAFRLAFALSAVYLAVVALTLLVQPFVSQNPLAFMRQSNLWLGPFQGLVSAAIGAFFVKSRPAGGEEEGE